jgi:hypothetical protein
MKLRFSPWAPWKERTKLAGLHLPGVYALAISPVNIAGIPFSWREEIVYVGMSNSKGGLLSRLRQFDNTIRGKDEHGGAHRVRFKHPDYSRLAACIYVSVCAVPCDVVSFKPHDLRAMGRVVAFEYECWAIFAERFGRLPEFNDKKRSPKRRKG